MNLGGASDFFMAKVYPNPATNYLTIEGLEGGHAIMTNSMGQVVKDFKVTDYRTLTDMRELTNGVYFLELRDAQGTSDVVKVVK